MSLRNPAPSLEVLQYLPIDFASQPGLPPGLPPSTCPLASHRLCDSFVPGISHHPDSSEQLTVSSALQRGAMAASKALGSDLDSSLASLVGSE